MRAVLSIMVLVLFAPVALGQKEERSLEELRRLARSRVGGLKQDFEDTFRNATRVFGGAAPDSDAPRVAKARSALVPWARVFAPEILELVSKTNNGNLGHHLVEVLVEAGDPAIAPLLAELLGSKSSEFDLQILGALARIGDPNVGPRIREYMASKDQPAVLAPALIALARIGDPAAAATARKHLAHPSPVMRASALRALSLAHDDPRGDAKLTLELAREDPELAVRKEALRDLVAYPGDPQVLRLLHDTVSGRDEALAEIALVALEQVATKDYSRDYLYKAVKSEFTLPLREQAARLMGRLGDPRGVRHLVQSRQDEADRKPRDRDLQRQVADEFKRLGGYDDALKYYQKSIDTRATPVSQYTIYLEIARCYAAQGRFADAKRHLDKAGYRDLSRFVDDPYFDAMRADPDFRDLFKRPR